MGRSRLRPYTVCVGLRFVWGAICCGLLGLVDGAAADYGAEDFRFCIFAGRDFREVGAEDDEVGELTVDQRALSSLFKLSVGRADGVGAYAVVEREFFLRLPAASGTAVGNLAGDAGVEAAHRVDGLDVVVGAEGEMNFIFEHRVPCVGAFDAVGADARFSPAHVGGLMRRLHGGDDVERGEAGEIGGRDDLGVLDAIATVARWVGFGDGFESVEGDGVGAIADGVKCELEAGFVALDRHLF